MSFFSSRAGLRPLTRPFSRMSLTRLGSTAATAAAIRPSAAMSTSAIVAAATVAVGAYAIYARGNAAQAAGPGGKPVFSGVGSYKTLQLSSADMVNDNVRRLRFELDDPQAQSGLSLTSALLAISFPGGSWFPTLRPYTPVNDLDTPGYIDLLVKHYPGGKQSTHLHSIKPGESITFVRIPGYSWKTNEQAHIGLVAGGQGITPCYQLLRGILKNPDDKTRVTLVWGVNRDSDLFLGDELAALQKEHPDRLKTVYVVSHPSAGSKYEQGHVTAEVLKQAGISQSAEKGSGVGKVFFSGPPPMEKALKGVLSQLGFTKKQVHGF